MELKPGAIACLSDLICEPDTPCSFAHGEAGEMTPSASLWA
jgi:hypothetical protein